VWQNSTTVLSLLTETTTAYLVQLLGRIFQIKRSRRERQGHLQPLHDKNRALSLSRSSLRSIHRQCGSTTVLSLLTETTTAYLVQLLGHIFQIKRSKRERQGHLQPVHDKNNASSLSRSSKPQFQKDTPYQCGLTSPAVDHHTIATIAHFVLYRSLLQKIRNELLRWGWSLGSFSRPLLYIRSPHHNLRFPTGKKETVLLHFVSLFYCIISCS
jgi:RNA-binding protein YhbY